MLPISVPPSNTPIKDKKTTADIFDKVWWKFFNNIVAWINYLFGLIEELQEGQQFIKYTISIVSGQWSINGRYVAAAASTTQALYLDSVATLTGYSHWILKTAVVFSGGGVTAASCTIGSLAGGNTFFSPVSYNLLTAVNNTNFLDASGPALATFADDQAGIVVTADQNWNTVGIVGTIDVYVLFQEVQE